MNRTLLVSKIVHHYWDFLSRDVLTYNYGEMER